MSGVSLPFQKTMSPVIFTPAPAPARAPRAGLGDTQLEALYQALLPANDQPPWGGTASEESPGAIGSQLINEPFVMQ